MTQLSLGEEEQITLGAVAFSERRIDITLSDGRALSVLMTKTNKLEIITDSQLGQKFFAGEGMFIKVNHFSHTAEQQ